MKIQILDKAKKKKIQQEIEVFGIKKIEPLLIKVGNERIKAYTGSLSNEELYDVYRAVPIEGMGLYFAKETISKKTGIREVRLSLDGVHMMQNHIKNNIIVLTKDQEKEWFLGKDIEVTSKQQDEYSFNKQFVVVMSCDKHDCIGTGKMSADGTIIFNYLPKERRRKN